MLELLAAALVAQTLSAMPADGANQGVAVDATHIYAVDNSRIVKYDRATGARRMTWTGDPASFPHLNSCAVIGPDLVCAASNYPAVPMKSSVEVFDPATLAHKRTLPLGRQPGSLTWLDRRDGAWWAGFANYDGRGGEPGRDHTQTAVVKFDDAWKPLGTWTFPREVLARFRPRSASGGAFGPDGRLYVTGHDLPEVYVLEVPPTGGVLKLVATIAVPVEGQAIAFDRGAERVLYGIVRSRRQVVAVKLPPVERTSMEGQ